MELETQKNITEFYDDFVKKQDIIGVSVRHRGIFNNLKRLGLKRDSNVLEIGCGIGTVSSLIIKHLSSGQFVGCDISPESIRYANEKYKNARVNFIVNDMSNFTSDLKFDFIVFPDVLEHIPIDQHRRLFENVAKVCKPDAKVLINIPEPNTLNWFRKNKPELLQIIDQSLSIQDLLNNVYPNGFFIESLTPYSIHSNVPNYLKIVLVRNPEVKEFSIKGKFAQAIQNFKVRFLG
jgi:ubiquinone/menaquinone biosynthesis C-methylase UbiE